MMNIKISYSGKKIKSIADIVPYYPKSEFDRITRSTVPSLLYWFEGVSRIEELALSLGMEVPSSCTLDFEHKVYPPKGKGKPSCTDVMISWYGVSIAVEAKFTEPPYDDVSLWTQKGENPENRRLVLDGWLDLISKRIGKTINIDDVSDIPYQMIHRLASVCSQDQPVVVMLYQIFMPDNKKKQYYEAKLHKLRDVFGNTDSLKLALSFVNFSTTGFENIKASRTR